MVTLALHAAAWHEALCATGAERRLDCRTSRRAVPPRVELNPRLARLREEAERIAAGRRTSARRRIATGLLGLDDLLGGGICTGATYELVSLGGASATWSLALHAATAAIMPTAVSPKAKTEPEEGHLETKTTATKAELRAVRLCLDPALIGGRWLIWMDPEGELYPPAAAALGTPLERLLVVRAPRAADVLWATEQALRCRAVAAVVAPLRALDVAASRRLQLAAEEGGGVGLLLREGPARGPCFAVGRLACEPAGGTLRVLRVRVTVQRLREAAPGATAVVDVPLVPNKPRDEAVQSTLRPAM